MPIISRTQLKQWFSRLMKPTGEQFAAWVDSFWHKDEQLPISSVANLSATLGGKAEQDVVNAQGGQINSILAALPSFALDNAVVHNFGAEIVGGAKSFTGVATFQNVIDLINGLTIRGVPTAGILQALGRNGILLTDRNGKIMVSFAGTEGDVDGQGMILYNPLSLNFTYRTAGAEEYSNMNVLLQYKPGLPGSHGEVVVLPLSSFAQVGTGAAQSPTNADAVHKTGAETIAGDKTFTGNTILNGFFSMGQNPTTLRKTAGAGAASALLADTYSPAGVGSLLDLQATNQVAMNFNRYTFYGLSPAAMAANGFFALTLQAKNYVVAGLDDINNSLAAYDARTAAPVVRQTDTSTGLDGQTITNLVSNQSNTMYRQLKTMPIGLGKTVVLEGASSMVGIGASTYAKSFAGLLTTDLKNAGYTVYNVAIPGTTSSQIIDRFNTNVASKHPDWVVLFCPYYNDAGQTVVTPVVAQTLLKNVKQYAQMCKDIGAKLILMGPYANSLNSSAQGYQIMKDLRDNLSSLDNVQFFDALTAGVDDANNGAYKTGLSADGIHNNDYGYQGLYQLVSLDFFKGERKAVRLPVMPQMNGYTLTNPASTASYSITLDKPQYEISVSAWFKGAPTPGSSQNYISMTNANGDSFRVGQANATATNLYHNIGTNTGVDIPGITLNVWNFVSWVVSANLATNQQTFKLYVNGVLKDTQTYAVYSPMTKVTFLQRFDGQFPFTNGSVIRPTIHYGGLFADDITRMYNGSVTTRNLKYYPDAASGAAYYGNNLAESSTYATIAANALTPINAFINNSGSISTGTANVGSGTAAGLTIGGQVAVNSDGTNLNLQQPASGGSLNIKNSSGSTVLSVSSTGGVVANGTVMSSYGGIAFGEQAYRIGAGGAAQVLYNSAGGHTFIVNGTTVATIDGSGNLTSSHLVGSASGAAIATLTFTMPYASAPVPAGNPAAGNAATAALSGVQAPFYTTTANTLVLNSNGTALAANAQYKWYYTLTQ